MNLFYAIYAFVLGITNFNSGMRLVKKEGWMQLVGLSALTVGVVALIVGFQALFGFYVNPIILLLPLVFAGFVITVESWRNVKHGGIFAWFIAIYNSFAWISNLLRLFYLLSGNRRD